MNSVTSFPVNLFFLAYWAGVGTIYGRDITIPCAVCNVYSSWGDKKIVYILVYR